MRMSALSRVAGALAATALAAAALFSAPAQSAESYASCTGTIDSVPAVIGTPGTWCLKQSLATTIASGAAITIAANNVILDCNDFKVGGLGSGVTTAAVGIDVQGSLNTTIRQCGIRGFRAAIRVSASSFGGLFEDNRIEGATAVGMEVSGGSHVIRRNRIVDVGGRPAWTQNQGILAFADQTTITDNQIQGVVATVDGGDVYGIAALGNAVEVGRNYISGLVPLGGGGEAIGVHAPVTTTVSIHDNQVLSVVDVPGMGIYGGPGNLCGGNRISGFAVPYIGCIDAGGNAGN